MATLLSILNPGDQRGPLVRISYYSWRGSVPDVASPVGTTLFYKLLALNSPGGVINNEFLIR